MSKPMSPPNGLLRQPVEPTSSWTTGKGSPPISIVARATPALIRLPQQLPRRQQEPHVSQHRRNTATLVETPTERHEDEEEEVTVARSRTRARSFGAERANWQPPAMPVVKQQPESRSMVIVQETGRPAGEAQVPRCNGGLAYLANNINEMQTLGRIVCIDQYSSSSLSEAPAPVQPPTPTSTTVPSLQEKPVTPAQPQPSSGTSLQTTSPPRQQTAVNISDAPRTSAMQRPSHSRSKSAPIRRVKYYEEALVEDKEEAETSSQWTKVPYVLLRRHVSSHSVTHVKKDREYSKDEEDGVSRNQRQQHHPECARYECRSLERRNRRSIGTNSVKDHHHHHPTSWTQQKKLSELETIAALKEELRVAGALLCQSGHAVDWQSEASETEKRRTPTGTFGNSHFVSAIWLPPLNSFSAKDDTISPLKVRQGADQEPKGISPPSQQIPSRSAMYLESSTSSDSSSRNSGHAVRHSRPHSVSDMRLAICTPTSGHGHPSYVLLTAQTSSSISLSLSISCDSDQDDCRHGPGANYAHSSSLSSSPSHSSRSLSSSSCGSYSSSSLSDLLPPPPPQTNPPPPPKEQLPNDISSPRELEAAQRKKEETCDIRTTSHAKMQFEEEEEEEKEYSPEGGMAWPNLHPALLGEDMEPESLVPEVVNEMETQDAAVVSETPQVLVYAALTREEIPPQSVRQFDQPVEEPFECPANALLSPVNPQPMLSLSSSCSSGLLLPRRDSARSTSDEENELSHSGLLQVEQGLVPNGQAVVSRFAEDILAEAMDAVCLEQREDTGKTPVQQSSLSVEEEPHSFIQDVGHSSPPTPKSSPVLSTEQPENKKEFELFNNSLIQTLTVANRNYSSDSSDENSSGSEGSADIEPFVSPARQLVEITEEEEEEKEDDEGAPRKQWPPVENPSPRMSSWKNVGGGDTLDSSEGTSDDDSSITSEGEEPSHEVEHWIVDPTTLSAPSSSTEMEEFTFQENITYVSARRDLAKISEDEGSSMTLPTLTSPTDEMHLAFYNNYHIEAENAPIDGAEQVTRDDDDLHLKDTTL